MAYENGTAPELKDASVGELLKQLAQETSVLVRKELELAKAETAEKGKKAGVGLGMFGGAGVMALGAFGALTAFFILVLGLVMPMWLSALIVTVVYGIIAGVLAVLGKDKVQEAAPATPEQTVETVKEDVEWAKTRMKSAQR